MDSRWLSWLCFTALLTGLSGGVTGCRGKDQPDEAAPQRRPTTAAQVAGSATAAPVAGSVPSAKSLSAPQVLKNEIPASRLDAVLAAHFRGVGLMEQFDYPRAAEEFREVHALAPGWIPGSVNLAIALLNMTGEQIETSKQAEGGAEVLGNFDEALKLLSGVLEREPDNAHAHFCMGIILEQQGDLPAAHRHFRRVTELDPHDAHAWYWCGSTLTDPENPLVTTSPKLAKEQIVLYAKALELDPYLTQAIYKLSFASRLAGDARKQKELLQLWEAMSPDRQQSVPGPGNSAAKKYGEMGKYATVIGPQPRSGASADSAAVPPRLEPARPLDVKLAAGDRWAGPADFHGEHAVIGRARARFGAALATFDANNDGKLDLYLTSAIVGPKGLRDALLLNRGEGRFEDASALMGLPPDQASLGVAAADFDADRQIDLFLTGVANNRLLRNQGGKTFADLTSTLKTQGPRALSLTARWIDLDQDGDLDLYVVNYCASEHADRAFREGATPPGLPNTVYRNDGRPKAISGAPAPAWAPLAVAWENVRAKSGLSLALAPWTEALQARGGDAAHTGIAVLDVDGDRDLDLVLSADESPPVAILSDRLGRFHTQGIKDLKLDRVSGLLVTDLDQDGRPDLVAPRLRGKLLALRNTTPGRSPAGTPISFESVPTDAHDWCTAVAADLDLDGAPDVVGLADGAGANQPSPGCTPVWARNEGNRLSQRELPVKQRELAATIETPRLAGLGLADLAGDALPDLLFARHAAPPSLARNLGNGHHWLALQLGGQWRVNPQLMRTNSHGIGTRVVAEGKGIRVVYDHTTPDAGLAQSIGPVILGLGKSADVDLIHLSWPDGVMQCELNVSANLKRTLTENNRKTGSCPVLFTWNGERFVCLGDFLGGGGLGYLVAPGVYSQPDRDEAVAISAEQLRAEQGVFRLSVSEPMDEVAYLDHLILEVVDRPPDVSVAPDERFAPTGTRPSGKLLAWRQAVEAVRATDLAGTDMTETLKAWDRRTVDSFGKLEGWIGYAQEHGIILDFGDRLSGIAPDQPLVLCLAGWVEYPYSQTNYAAATAGVTLKPPTIERVRDDGAWDLIEPHAGYPAGLPRMTTLDLTGKLSGARCVLRIKTNMECYYDQAFLAVRDLQAEKALRTTALPVARAVLGYRGYSREVSPDGRLPLIYDYAYVDPVPLARMSGMLTRYGDVATLLQADDDRLCVVGPGDEARLEFNAASLPPLPSGWSRSYVLRTYGYCKDADPFTATSDTVEPLPWRTMPAFPFPSGYTRPASAAHES